MRKGLLFLPAEDAMRKRGQQYFLSSLLLITLFSLEVPKRAFRFYERGDIEKTVDALQKSLEKDSLNPAAYYLYSVLQIDTAYSDYSVDKAYTNILRAIDQFKTVTDPKDFEDLKEVAVDSAHLERQKDRIDSLKFLDIRAIHTIEAYNVFMQTHNDALQIPKAIGLRNQIAFANAQKVNTWQGYKQFMEEYPQAIQYADADSLYKLLIYQERTADGQLKSYRSFIEEFPGTPYLDEIIPEIFKIATAANRIEDYETFLKEFPSEELQKIAYKRIYHIFKEKFGTEDFLKYFPSKDLADSINNIHTLNQDFWIPKLTDGFIEFVDSNGQPKLKTKLTTIPQANLCEPILEDFISGSFNDKQAIIGRDGHLIYSGHFTSAKEARFGYIILETDLGKKLIHKSGEVIIAEPKEEIAILNESFIRTRNEGFYGLQSIHGLTFLDNEFVMIDTLGQFIWLEKEDGIALISPEILYPALEGESLSIEYSYDEVEVLNNGRIWVSRNSREAILDQQLKTIIPFGNYEIREEDYGWKLISDKGIKVLHDRYTVISANNYTEVKENQQWLALKLERQWHLLDQVGNIPMQDQIDSLSFLGENMVMLQKGNKLIAQFKNGKQLTMEKDWEYKLLIPQSYIKTGAPAVEDYFMLSNSKNFRKIYNKYGREILAATFNEVTALGPNMLRLQKRNAALADSTGHFLLNFVYDAIGSNDNGYVSILDKGKVGVINPSKQINIGPEYEKLLERYSDSVLVATKGRYKGFINSKNKVLTAFEFDEVKYFNDSIALVRIDDEWLLENIKNEDILYERIKDFEVIDVGVEDKTLFITTATGQGIYSETLGQVIEPTYTFIRILGTQKDPIYFAVKLVAEANIYVVIYYDKKGNKLFTQSFRQDEYFKIACPTN